MNFDLGHLKLLLELVAQKLFLLETLLYYLLIDLYCLISLFLGERG